MPLKILVLSPLLAIVCTACEPAPSTAVKSLTPQYDANGRLARLAYDRDNDGTVDTWGYMSGTRVIRVEVDENQDGKVDRWEFHRQTGPENGEVASAGPDKTIERIERATRLDGRITRREFFADGALTRVEEDTDADGVVDKWETYKDGTLITMTLDTANRGTPDRRLVYRNDGTFDHLEVDEAGSGQFIPVAR